MMKISEINMALLEALGLADRAEKIASLTIKLNSCELPRVDVEVYIDADDAARTKTTFERYRLVEDDDA